jgi:hypothetical protein
LSLWHAYLPLEDAILHALGLQPTQSVILEKYQMLFKYARGHQCSAAAQYGFGLLPSNLCWQLVCCMTLWFNGWDPNSSMSKANTTPILSGTLTLIFATLLATVVYFTTHIVASGPGTR